MYTFLYQQGETILSTLGCKLQGVITAELDNVQKKEAGQILFILLDRWEKKGPQKQRRVVATSRFPKIEGSIGFLIEQRAKHWAELCQDLRTPGSSRPDLDVGLR